MVPGSADGDGGSTPRRADHQQRRQLGSIQAFEERHFQVPRPATSIQLPQTPAVPQIFSPRGPGPSITNVKKRKLASDASIENYAPPVSSQVCPSLVRPRTIRPTPQPSNAAGPSTIVPAPHVIATPQPTRFSGPNLGRPGFPTYLHARPTPLPCTPSPTLAALSARSTPNGFGIGVTPERLSESVFPPMKRFRAYSHSNVLPLVTSEVPGPEITAATSSEPALGVDETAKPECASGAEALDLFPDSFNEETATLTEGELTLTTPEDICQETKAFLKELSGNIHRLEVPLAEPHSPLQLVNGNTVNESGSSVEGCGPLSEEIGVGISGPALRGATSTPLDTQPLPAPPFDLAIIHSLFPEDRRLVKQLQDQGILPRGQGSPKPALVDGSGATGDFDELLDISLAIPGSFAPTIGGFTGASQVPQPTTLFHNDLFPGPIPESAEKPVGAEEPGASVGDDEFWAALNPIEDAGLITTFDKDFNFDFSGGPNTVFQLDAPYPDPSGAEYVNLDQPTISNVTPVDVQPDIAASPDFTSIEEWDGLPRTDEPISKPLGNESEPLVIDATNVVPAVVNVPPPANGGPEITTKSSGLQLPNPIVEVPTELPMFGRIPARLVFPHMQSVVDASTGKAPVDEISQTIVGTQQDKSSTPPTSSTAADPSVSLAERVANPSSQEFGLEPIPADLTTPNNGGKWVLCSWGLAKKRCGKVLRPDAESIQAHLEADHAKDLVGKNPHCAVLCRGRAGKGQCRAISSKMGEHLLKEHLSVDGGERICQKCWGTSIVSNGTTWCLSCWRKSQNASENWAAKVAAKKKKRRLLEEEEERRPKGVAAEDA